MLQPKGPSAPGPFTFDEYMAWEAEQEEKWELVDGYAYRRSDRWHYDPVTGMAGATYAHTRIQANLVRHLGNRLAGGRCEALPSEIKTRSPTGASRYPDVTVQCGRTRPDDLLSSEPRVLFDVLSKSNTLRQQLRVLEDYQAIPEVQQIVFLEESSPSAIVWTRQPGGWTRDDVVGLDSALPLASIEQSLPMSEVYEGLDFDASAA